MDLAAKLVALLTAVVGLSAAYLTFKAKRTDFGKSSLAAPDTSPSSRIRSIEYKRQPKRFTRWFGDVRFMRGFALFATVLSGGAFTAWTYVFLFRNWVAGLLNMLWYGFAFYGCFWVFRRTGRAHALMSSEGFTRVQVEVSGEYKLVFATCLTALEKINAQVEESDISVGNIVGRCGLTLWSIGETISITVRPSDRGNVTVDLSSDSLQKFVLFDFGKNRRNVQKLIKLL